ncbi:hypothetical protein NN6n1_12750 [Shinella zoogloeoides]
MQSEAKAKALEWRVFCSRSGNSEAKTPFGEYVIQSERDGWMLYLLNEQDACVAHSTIDLAKAAAQADYEQRIRSALVDVPAVEPVACACCGKPFGDEGPYCLCVYTHRDWKKNTMERPHRVTNYGRLTSPSLTREGEDSAEVERALAFVARWAWREDPSNAVRKLTDAERLSAIKHHPTIKALADTRSGSATTQKGISDE